MTDITWTPIKIRLDQIILWDDNPRLSTVEQAKRLVKSEAELGQMQTLAVSPYLDDGRVYLYDGHQRVSIWLASKSPSFEVWALQSSRMLTDDERRKVAVLLHTATGSWDWDTLSSWDAENLKEWGMDKETLAGWNNDAMNLREMFQSDVDINSDDEWQGMPEYNNKDLLGKEIYKTLIVRFITEQDYQKFGELIEQKLTKKTKSIWYPHQDFDQLGNKEGLIYSDES